MKRRTPLLSSLPIPQLSPLTTSSFSLFPLYHLLHISSLLIPLSPSLFPLFIPAFLYSLSSSPPSPLANSTPSTLISLSPLPYPLIALLSLFILPSHPSLSPFTSPPFPSFLHLYIPVCAPTSRISKRNSPQFDTTYQSLFRISETPL